MLNLRTPGYFNFKNKVKNLKVAAALTLLTLMLPVSGFSQLVNFYNFYQGSTPYTLISAGTVLGSGASYDNQVHTSIPLGFTFSFNGSSYTTIGLSSNGFAWFGSAAPSTTNYTPISSTASNPAFLSPYGRNIEARTNGELRYTTIGTAPTRIFIAQWRNFQRSTTGTTDNTGEQFNFQLRLYEYDYTVAFTYGTFATTVNGNAQVGLRAATNTDYFNRSVGTANTWATSSNGITNTATALISSTKIPASGQYYKWIPRSIDNKLIGGGTLDTIGSGQAYQAFNAMFQEVGMELYSTSPITSALMNSTVNGILQPPINLTLASGNNLNGIWQGSLPPVSTSGDVTYFTTFQNAAGESFNLTPLAYEVNYLRVSGPVNQPVLLDPTTGTGVAQLRANISVSNVKFTELSLFPNLSAASTSAPFITQLYSNDYLELTNLGTAGTDLSGFSVEFHIANTLYSMTFPEGTVPDTGKTMVIRIGTDTGEILDPSQNFFGINGPKNMMDTTTKAGFILKNRIGEVVDAFAINGFEFPASSGVTISKWYGENLMVGSAPGLTRKTPTDHNSSADWSQLNSLYLPGMGIQNSSLYAILDMPQVYWQLPSGATLFGESISFPMSSPGVQGFSMLVNDGPYSANGFASVEAVTSLANPPVADFTADNVTPLQYAPVTFTDLSSENPTTWSWNFSPATFTYINGTTASSQNPQVKFNAGGTYTVSLTVTNSGGSDTETKVSYITVAGYTSSCVKPTGVTVSQVTATSAKISWNSGLYAESFEIRYRRNLCGAYQYVTVPGGAGNFVVINGLIAGSYYECWVRSICGGVASSWSSVRCFITPCNSRYSMQENDYAGSSGINIYPSPAISEVFISLPGDVEGDLAIQIFDAAGRLVSDKKDLLTYTETVSMDVSALKAGIYLMVVTSGENQWSSRMVKQ
jgi:PKD repeat protein